MPGAAMNGSKLKETKVLQSNKRSSRKEEETVLLPPCHGRSLAKSGQAVPPSLVRNDSTSTTSSDGDSDDPVETCMDQFYDMLGKHVDDMLFISTEEKEKGACVITKKAVNRKNTGEKFTNEESNTILNAFWSLCGSNTNCLEDQEPPSTPQKKISLKRPIGGAKGRLANTKPLEKATDKDDNKNIKISSSTTATIESPQSELNPSTSKKDDDKKIKISSSSTSPIESPQSEIDATTSKNGVPVSPQATTVLVQVESNHTQTLKDMDKVDDIDSTPIPSSQSVASDRSSKSIDNASPSGSKDSPSAASGANTSLNSKQDDDMEFPDDEYHAEKSTISEVAPSKGEYALFKGDQSENFSDSHKTIDDVSDLVTETVEVPNGESGSESQDSKMDEDPTLNATEINSEKSELDGSTKKSESDVTANHEAHDEKLVNVDEHDEKHDVSDMANKSLSDVLGV